MKRHPLLLLLALPCILAVSSCNDFLGSEAKGSLKIFFGSNLPLTKSSVPDTNDFIIKVSDGSGNIKFNGNYGSLPEDILLNAGTYTVEAYSREFCEPLFDAPMYGDTRVAQIKSGTTTTVELECVQQNAGVLLRIDSSFLAEYPDGLLYLKSKAGKLLYSYSEKRIAYFLPGTVSLILDNGGTRTTLMSRSVEAQQILCVNLSVAGNGSGDIRTYGGIALQIDTTRNWTSENFEIGGENPGDQTSTAMSVTEAKNHIGQTDVWVYGYIVGGDCSSSRCSFEGPFSSRTNFVIAGKSSCTNKESCLSVQLAKGDIRDELNLVDNPENLGRQILIKADIVEAYFGIPGLQSISEYKWK